MKRIKKIAIVYDWFDSWGGVERILLTFSLLFPHADFFTSFYDEKKAFWAKNLVVKTSFLQYLPSFIKKHRLLMLPLFSYAFESFDFSQYDAVISVTSSFAKSIITKPPTKHICYLLTPTRYFWGMTDEYLQSPMAKALSLPFLTRWRKWDYIAAQRPDTIISISQTVAMRCKKYYRRESEIIYPPFDSEYWKNIQNSKLKIPSIFSDSEGFRDKINFFLIVSRLEPYKKVDLAIRVFNKRKELLVVVGKGTRLSKLKQLAGENIVFLQDITDEELAWLYCHAKALIMPQEEDFGYTAVEAQFFGCPVIAYRKGGAGETIKEGQTGLFFEAQTENSLYNTLERFKGKPYNIKHIVQTIGKSQSSLFEKRMFKAGFLALLQQ